MNLAEILGRSSKTYVFGGPSLSLVSAERLERVELCPPAKRGSLAPLLEEQPGIVLIVDGLFGASMAVTPLECRELLTHGWSVIGCSSIGALRASELWSAGMIGIGTVFHLLRMGVIDSDADLAVAYSQSDWEEISVAMIQIRSLITHLEIADRNFKNLLLAEARSIYWMERTWQSVFQAWKAINLPTNQLERAQSLIQDQRLHPKKQDAIEAFDLLEADIWINPSKETH